MAKKKKSLAQEKDKFLNQAKGELGKLKDCNFEEFKEEMIALGEMLLAGQLQMMEWLGEERQKLFDMAVDAIKQVRAANEKDFQKAERNFQGMFKMIQEFDKKVAKTEATSLISLMYTCAGIHAMGKRRLVTETTLNEGLRLIPKRVKKHIIDTLEVKPKEFDKCLAEALEATSA